MMTSRDCCLIILAKEPVTGRVKKRLSKDLGQENAVALYKAFLKDTYSLAHFLPVHFRILAYESFGGIPDYLYSTFPHFVFYPQHGDDLGSRIQDIIVYARHLGAQRIVIIGSDSPTLPSELISESFERLKDHDVVIGPCRDGGVYLFGVKGVQMGVLRDVDWGTDRVFEQIKRNVGRSGRSFYELCAWYDIDQLTDLKQLKKIGVSPKVGATKAVIQAMGREVLGD